MAFQIAVKLQCVFFNLIRMGQYLLRHGLGRFYVGFEKQWLTIIASVSSRHSAKKNRAKLTVSAVHAKSKRNSVAISILRVECELSYNGKCSRQHLQALCCHFRPDHILLGMGVDPNLGHMSSLFQNVLQHI